MMGDRLVPKQLLTVALGDGANPRAFSRTLFRLEVQPKLVSPGGFSPNIYPWKTCNTWE